MFKFKRIFLTTFIAFAICTMTYLSNAKASENGLAIEPEQSVDAVTRGGGVLRKFKYVTDNTIGSSTTSTTLVQVPNMSVSFNTLRKGTMVITYDATVWATGRELIYISAQVDGVNASPGEIQLAGDMDEDDDGQWARTHSFTFVAPDIPAGKHTVKIMWRSFFGGSVITHWRSMVVSYKR